MKSLRDEIRTYVRDKEDGFNFIVSEANDFIRGRSLRISPRLCRDFMKSRRAGLCPARVRGGPACRLCGGASGREQGAALRFSRVPAPGLRRGAGKAPDRVDGGTGLCPVRTGRKRRSRFPAAAGKTRVDAVRKPHRPDAERRLTASGPKKRIYQTRLAGERSLVR